MRSRLKWLLLGMAAIWLAGEVWHLMHDGWLPWLGQFVLRGLPPLVIGCLVGAYWVGIKGNKGDQS